MMEKEKKNKKKHSTHISYDTKQRTYVYTVWEG